MKSIAAAKFVGQDDFQPLHAADDIFASIILSQTWPILQRSHSFIMKCGFLASTMRHFGS
jgi:hypothetical protein